MEKGKEGGRKENKGKNWKKKVKRLLKGRKKQWSNQLF